MNRKNLANKVKASMLAIATFAMLFVSCEDDEKLGVELPSLTVTPSTLTLKVGEKEMAEANITPVIWSSSAATIAAVDPATGEITALALGTATVTATRSDGETATCSVIVLPVRPITGVRITPVPVPEVVAGDILRLSAVPVPEDATDFNPVWVWSSSDGTVAAVSETGLLTGVSAGMATITVTLADDPAITTQTAVTIASPFNFIPVGTMTSNELKAFASNAGYSDYVNLMKTGISIHKVEYSTSLNNSKVKVSGLLVIPETVSAQRAIAVYNHGTMKKDVAPSFCNTTNPYPDIAVCYCFTSALNVVFLIPDYIGHGKSVSTVHLYVHAESLGQTSLDMIRTYINSEMPGAAPENRKVVIMGYSEGGYASVALHKKIQETAPDIQIVKTYAGAGPYDLKYFMKEVLQKNEELPENTISSYLWVLDTYKKYAGYAKPYGEIFSEEDNNILKSNGYDLAYLAKYPINRNPQKLFRQEYIETVMNDGDASLNSVIEANTLVNFVPTSPLYLFHSEADDWVYVGNTNNTYRKMRENGVPASVVTHTILPASENKGHEAAVGNFIVNVAFDLLLFQAGKL